MKKNKISNMLFNLSWSLYEFVDRIPRRLNQLIKQKFINNNVTVSSVAVNKTYWIKIK